ncbi:MAG: hypothetical protein H6727_18210 [Myxococcales bacterium]|nr:hypothetical protein [Myxococcales bacterium]
MSEKKRVVVVVWLLQALHVNHHELADPHHEGQPHDLIDENNDLWFHSLIDPNNYRSEERKISMKTRVAATTDRGEVVDKKAQLADRRQQDRPNALKKNELTLHFELGISLFLLFWKR